MLVHVASLWRYPVKSMQGDRCSYVSITTSGVADDRSFGVLDATNGTIVSAKRDGRLLTASARLDGKELVVRLPGDDECRPGKRLDEALSQWLGRESRLVAAAGHGMATFESPEDFEDDGSPLERWEGNGVSFVDESDLHLLTTGDLELRRRERPDLQWELRRFRPNIVVDAGPDALGDGEHLGRHVTIGDVELEIYKACARCVMTTRAQPFGIEKELDILRHTIKEHANKMGVRARVVRPGLVREGDPVQVSGPEQAA